MKILYFAAVILFPIALFSCSSASEMLLDSFEGELNHKTVDYGSGGGASLVVSAEKTLKIHGEQSIKLEYDISEGGYQWTARGYKLDVAGAANWTRPAEKIKWHKFSAFNVYMYGTNSGGKVAFDVKDSGFEMWRFMLEDNFTGWKKIIVPFSDFFVRADWQPYNADKNKELNFPIMSFQFEPRRPFKGVYYFDQVSLAK